MVASARSENLNPQYWKQVRVLESKGTAPASQSSLNTQESAPLTQSAGGALDPSAAGNQVAGHVITHVVQESVSTLVLTPRENDMIPPLLAYALQSQDTGLAPLAIAAPTVPQMEAPTTENSADGLDPHVAGDKLEGYVPRYFLKEDGKRDDT